MTDPEFKPWGVRGTSPGTPTASLATSDIPVIPEPLPASTPPPLSIKGGFVQTFGLDVRVAILTVLVDTVVGTIDFASFGFLWGVECFAGVILAFITYRAQRSWYGDSHDNAIIKAAIVGLLTAIPGPIDWIFAGPGGVLGIIHALRGKK